MLANLLQNAVRYTPDGGRVTVSGESRPGSVLVSVINTGEPIPADDLPHVFERFYRVEKSRDRASGGAGIGLAIVKQLVEAGGGRVGAESSPDRHPLLVQRPWVVATGRPGAGVILRGPWGCSSVGRAPRSHRGGQGFESPHLHHRSGSGRGRHDGDE